MKYFLKLLLCVVLISCGGGKNLIVPSQELSLKMLSHIKKNLDLLNENRLNGGAAYFLDLSTNKKMGVTKEEIIPEGAFINKYGTTARLAKANLYYYLHSKENHYLQVARSICKRLIETQLSIGGWSYFGLGDTDMKVSNPYSINYASFDDGITTEIIDVLYDYYSISGDEKALLAVKKAINLIIDIQKDDGSWAMIYPITGKYMDKSTFNDKVMNNIIATLIKCKTIDNRIPRILQMAKKYIFSTQALIDNKYAGWAEQYDGYTPTRARSFEPAHISAAVTGENIITLLKLYSILSDEDILPRVRNARDFLIEVRMNNGKWARFYDGKNPVVIGANRDEILLRNNSQNFELLQNYANISYFNNYKALELSKMIDMDISYSTFKSILFGRKSISQHTTISLEKKIRAGEKFKDGIFNTIVILNPILEYLGYSTYIN